MTKDDYTGSTTKGAQPGVSPAPETSTPQDNSASLSALPQEGAANASSTPGSAYSVELRIEELVLHGFADSERYRIGDAIERELTRLFTEQGAPPTMAQGGEIAQLDGGTFEVKPDPDAETTGVQLAQAIYRGLGQ